MLAAVQTRPPFPTVRARDSETPMGSGRRSISLLVWAAAINASLFAAIGIRHVDREAIAFAVLYLAGLGLLRFRRGILGVILLALLSLDTEFWMLTATVSNFQNQESFMSVLQPLALSIVSAVVILAAAASLLQRGRRTPQAGRAIAAVSVVVFAVAFATELILSNSSAQIRPSDVVLNIQNAAFSAKQVSASSGQVSVSLTNQDLFWHTFTVDKLGLNVTLPVNSHRRVTFNAAPGTYTFYCAIPGHRQAGMQGTITIR
jgi:plastocyanin